MKIIKNILVPTDFSATSRNAFHYAQKLAAALNATLTVVHIQEYFVPISEIAVAPLSDKEDSKINEAMQEFIADEAQSTGLMVENKVITKIIEGDPVSRLIELSESDDVDLMVVGTTGLQDFLSKIIGSTSLELSNKARCPVMLIPRDARWQEIDRVMYASNYQSTTSKMIRDITDFAISVNAAIHFVHIQEDTHSEDQNGVSAVIWDELFSLTDPTLSFEIHTITSGDKIEELKKYAEDHNIHLLAFASKQRTFWDNLMHKSLTQNMAISTSTPLLVLHLEENE